MGLGDDLAAWADESLTLPDHGPADPARVRQLVGSDAPEAELMAARRAVDNLVRSSGTARAWAALYDTPPEAWPPRVVEGASLLAARIWRRRGSIGGVEAFGDLGPVYVRRWDPDIATMLGMGASAGPRIG